MIWRRQVRKLYFFGKIIFSLRLWFSLKPFIPSKQFFLYSFLQHPFSSYHVQSVDLYFRLQLDEDESSNLLSLFHISCSNRIMYEWNMSLISNKLNRIRWKFIQLLTILNLPYSLMTQFFVLICPKNLLLAY